MGFKQSFEAIDFSGGITDNLFGTKFNSAEILDNFTITPDKKLFSRPGSEVDDDQNDVIPDGNKRIGALINYAKNDKLFVYSANKIFYRSGSGTGAYSTLQGPSSNEVFSAGSTSSAPSWAEWNKQLFVTNDSFPVLMKIYKDSGGVYRVRNAGMPALASAPTVTRGAAGTNTYVYAFVYAYTYTVGTQTFLERGAPKLITLSTAAAPNSNTVAVSSIPVLVNGGTNNYDTTVIKVEIYRTITNGTNFYKVNEVTNGTTTFNDSTSDTTLQTGVPLYINDGTLDYDAPPSAKFVHVVGNVGLLGFTKDTNGEHPYRLQQSNPTNVNFWPAGFTLDVQEEIKGVNSVSELPIVLCQKKIFRIDGFFDSYGRNGMTAIKIHDAAGCLSNLSCVEAEGMLYWWGNDGIYSTDGYKVNKVTDHLNTKYADILAATSAAAQKRIYAKFDDKNRRIHWCCEQDSSNSENDTVVTLDLRWGVSNEMTAYTWTGDSFRPTALEIFNGDLYRADSRGYVFRHDQDLTTDPAVDENTDADLWYEETVIWTYKSIQMNFGGSFFRKMVTRILLQAGNVGDTTIQITAINDQGKSTRDLKQIRWRRNVTWGDEEFVWGNADCVWNTTSLINQFRRFPARGIRLSYLQVQITNALGIVAISDDNGLATVNTAANTVTLVDAAQTWPAQSIGYFLAFPNDNYTRLFEVSAINGARTVLTVLDAGNNLPVNGNYKWELKGYRKNETLNLLGYNLHWDNVDQNQGTFHAGDDGGNA